MRGQRCPYLTTRYEPVAAELPNKAFATCSCSFPFFFCMRMNFETKISPGKPSNKQPYRSNCSDRVVSIKCVTANFEVFQTQNEMKEAIVQKSEVAYMEEYDSKSKTSSESSASYEPPKESTKNLLKRPKKSRLQKAKTPLTKRYFTAALGITAKEAKEARLQTETSPFGCPADVEEFAYKVMKKQWREDVRIKELQVSCSKKPGYKDRQNRNLLQRLFIEEPKIQSMKTILDINPQFFKIVEGRPINDHLDIRSYVETVRECLRTKIINGYTEDYILLLQENVILEQKIIDEINVNYNKYVNIFEELLYRDHTSAMTLLKDSEKAARDAFDKYEEYKQIAKKYGALQSSLYTSEEKWRNCKMYEKFLFLVSPVSWRKENANKRTIMYQEDESQTNDTGLQEDELSVVEERDLSVTNVLETFREECQDDVPPELYFTSPEQLLGVFRFIAVQNLNALLHLEELAHPLEQVREEMQTAENTFDEEITKLQETIDSLEGGIHWEEARALYLEQLALDLIENDFKKLITNDDVLNLHVFVEEVYETRIGPNDANISTAKMMKAIESKYRNDLLFLDKVPSEQIAQLEGSCYSEQIQVMKLAEKASRQFAELEMLTYRLNKSLAPPFVKPRYKDLKKRSPPVVIHKPPPPPPRELTDSEMEYLDFFTDFCKYTDNPKDYGINTQLDSENAQVEEEEDSMVSQDTHPDA